MKQRKRGNKKKTILLLMLTILLSTAVFICDNTQELKQDKQGFELLERKGYGTGKRSTELEVEIGETKEKVTIQTDGRAYTKEEVNNILTQVEDGLEKQILNQNKSLDEVRTDLNLYKEIPGLGVKINWESDRYDVISQDGTVHNTELEAEGAVVQLKAVLTCQDEKEEYVFSVRILPPKYSKREQILQNLEREITKYDEQSKTEPYQILPKTMDGQKIRWNYVTNYRALGLVLMGGSAALFLYFSERQKTREKEEKRTKDLIRQYPQLISKFTLYLGAGMTVRTAWFRMANEYETGKQEKGRQEAYEEMMLTMYEIKGGTPEGEAYEHFGDRCRLPSYRKFSVLLSQNLKKGTKGLNVLLRQESENAFEERKNAAKKLGEEAGTKMLFPMFLMLGVVLVMIVIPAFFSLQLS